MKDLTFITDLNYEQIDVLNNNEINDCIYYNAKIWWGIKFQESMRDLTIIPFVERIQVWCGDDVLPSNKMLIIKNNYMDIRNNINEENEFKFGANIIRDNPYSEEVSLVRPKFVGLDIKDKIVEVLFNA